jgi:hypothetical protein
MYSQTSKCGISSAIAYVHPLKTSNLRYIDTIVICKDEQRSRDIQINRILGLDLDTEDQILRVYEPDNIIKQNLKPFAESSSYYGALVFDAYQAWMDETATITYRGDSNAKKFVFRYTATGTCIGTSITKEIVIVVTEMAF